MSTSVHETEASPRPDRPHPGEMPRSSYVKAMALFLSYELPGAAPELPPALQDEEEEPCLTSATF